MGVVPHEISFARLFAIAPIAFTNRQAKISPIEAEIMLNGDLVFVEETFDGHAPRFSICPRETVDLRGMALGDLFAGGPIIFTITKSRFGAVKLGVEAPPEITIVRSELLQRPAC